VSRPSGERRFRLVVFDWDGTLIDSIGTIVDCTWASLTALGLGQIPETRIRALIGSGLAESIRTLAPEADEATFRRVLDTYRRLWVEEYHYRSRLFDGAREVVERLAGSGYLVAVATAKSRRGLRLDLDRLDLDGLFDASRTADEAAAKPSPAMLEAILDELGVRAADALMVGDSTHDVEMAHNAGVAAVAVAGGAVPVATLRDAAPLACLPSVTDLPAWLDDGERRG